MPGSKNDSGDDDASSMHSFGSCTDADEEDSVLSTSSSFSNTSRRALASRLSGQSPAHVIPPASAQKSSSERHYAPMASTERAKRSGEAEAAIEAQWEQAEGKLRDAQDNTALRGEIEQLKATLKHARKDAKYLRERMEQMAAENRVLRRDPRKGKRDAVIEQLEVELQRKEQERADMEESLSNAFSAVIKELQARVTGLTAERDRLLVSAAEASGRKGGFMNAKT